MKFLILTLFKDFLASLGRRFKYSVAIKAPKKLISRTCIIGKDATSKRVQKPIFSFQLRFKNFAGKGSRYVKWFLLFYLFSSVAGLYFCAYLATSALPCILYTKEIKEGKSWEGTWGQDKRESQVKTSKTHSKCNNRNLLWHNYEKLFIELSIKKKLCMWI